MSGIVDVKIKDQGAYDFLLNSLEALRLLIFITAELRLPAEVESLRGADGRTKLRISVKAPAEKIEEQRRELERKMAERFSEELRGLVSVVFEPALAGRIAN